MRYRLSKLCVAAVAALMSVLPMAMNAQDFAIGADCGWSTEYANKGYKLYNYQGEERECTALMKEMGMNAMRIRVWVDPSKHDNWCNKEDVLKKCQLAKQQGMDIMINFHYSDWWADPAKQNIPEAWAKHSYKKMKQDLANHTIDVLTMLKENGIAPKWVQVGNEISNGMLWSVKMDPVTGWELKDAEGNTTITQSMGHVERNPQQYAGFFAAGYDAVKQVFPDAKVIVHLDNGFDNALYNRNLDVLKENGAKWDIIGMSLYPYWAMQAGRESTALYTIADCMKNIRLVSKKYDCDVIITEIGFEVDEQNAYKMEEGREQLADVIHRALTETNGRCKGVFYWEPECRPSQYKLGAFTEDGHPTAIMRGLLDAQHQGCRSIDVKNYDRQLVTIKTTEGDITLELYNETPGHRDNFLRIARSGALDSTLFHRVIKNFMIQGGGPDSKTAPATSKENPAPLTANEDVLTPDGKNYIPAEIKYPLFWHKRGAVAAAREPDNANPTFNSSSSQFYIVWGRKTSESKRDYVPQLQYYKDDSEIGTPWLDGGYTVYGQVVSGMDVVDRIQNYETDSNDRPIKDVRVLQLIVNN